MCQTYKISINDIKKLWSCRVNLLSKRELENLPLNYHLFCRSGSVDLGASCLTFVDVDHLLYPQDNKMDICWNKLAQSFFIQMNLKTFSFWIWVVITNCWTLSNIWNLIQDLYLPIPSTYYSGWRQDWIEAYIHDYIQTCLDLLDDPACLEVVAEDLSGTIPT